MRGKLRDVFLKYGYNGGNDAQNLSIFLLQVRKIIIYHFWKYRKNNIKRFVITTDKSIPDLSWLLEISSSGANAIVGSKVEKRSNSFVEGAWSEDFDSFEFEKSKYLFGSGVKFKHGSLIICPPKQTEEKIFMLVDALNKITYISNSISFILSRSSFYKEDVYRDFIKILCDSGNGATNVGIDRYTNLFFINSRYKWYRFMYYNFLVDKDGRFKIIPNYLAHRAPFRDFTSYYRFLSKITCQLFINARAKERKVQYTPLTTVSSGYDSPAVSIIAKNNGCKEAVTFEVEVMGSKDSGVEIAKRIGLKCKIKKHPSGDRILDLNSVYGERIEKLAYEFLATDGVGDDFPLTALEDEIKNRILLTGAYGDSVWASKSDLPSGLPVRIIFGKSLTEFRLRTGFIFLPLPFVGARYHQSIKDISKSKEMEEYRIGGEYDRPIPRRIIEDYGISRGMFAKTKVAISPLLLRCNQLKEKAFKVVIKRYNL